MNTPQGMIRFVTSADLQRRLFEIHAPSLDGKINWGKIAKMELNARAAKLNEAMLSLNDINLREHDRLCRTLSAIAAIAKNAANTPFMESQIKAARLWDRYWPDDFGMKKGAKTTANIAAWINTLAHDTSGDDDERQRADDIWNRLLVVAEKADNARNPYTFDLSEQIKFGDEMREGISSFQKEISAAMRGRLGLKHFPVMVQSSPRGRCIRFDVIMPQYPHDSTQTEEDLIFVGRDPQRKWRINRLLSGTTVHCRFTPDRQGDNSGICRTVRTACARGAARRKKRPILPVGRFLFA